MPEVSSVFSVHLRGALLRGSALLIGTCLLAGCSYLKPHVKRDVTPDNVPSRSVMPLTAAALSKVDKWLVSVDDAHSTHSLTKRSLNLATFALVAGVGVGAATGSSASSLRDAALAAGVTVAGSSLFAPDEQLRLYATASKALVCVRSRGTTLRATVEARIEQLRASSPGEFVSQTFTPAPCALDKETAAALGRYSEAHNRASTAVQQAALSDPSIAAKIENAGQNVVVALNEQLDLLVPSNEAILNSARSAGSIAAALYTPPAAATAPQPAVVPAACSAKNSESLESVRNRLEALTVSALAMEAAVAEQVNAVAALDTSCTVAPLQFSAVTLNNTDVTIAKDSKMHIAISGGWGLYFWSPVGAPPPAELSVDIIGSTLILTAKSTLAAGNYVLSVKDSSAVPRPAQLKITAK